MKKLLLYGLLLFSFIANSQSLLTEDCSTLSVGNVATDLTGATAGQGGWTTYVAPTATPAGQNTDFQIIDNGDANGKKIQITGPSGGNGSRFMQKPILDLWQARDSGKDIAEVEFDFYTGTNVTTSNNNMRVYLYDTPFTTGILPQILAGFIYTKSTGVLTGICLYDNAGTIGNSPFFLNSGADIILDPDTWYHIGFSFNYVTGDVIFRGANGLFNITVPGAAAGIEVDTFNVGVGFGATANASSTVGLFDNIVCRATNTDTLLGVNSNTISSTSFSVYPNPASNFVKISNTQALISFIEMTDINGRIVKNVSLSNVNDAQINISDLAQGVYMMKIVSDKGTVTKKIIKE